VPPVSPTDLVAILLLAAALFLVPSALAFALFSLARSDRHLPPPPENPHRAAVARHSPRRAVGPGRSPRRDRPGPPGPRRFGGR